MAAELIAAESALAEAELTDVPAQRFLFAHLAALRVAAVVLACRASRRGGSRPRDVWQVLADVAPEYAEWAGFFAFSALKRQAVQAGAVALVGTREADDLLRDVRLFHDQVAARLRRASATPVETPSLVELVETSVPRVGAEGGLDSREPVSGAGSLDGQTHPDLESSPPPPPPVPLVGVVETLPPSVIPADTGISELLVETLPSTVIPANAGISNRTHDHEQAVS
jgi:hypothetical protein